MTETGTPQGGAGGRGVLIDRLAEVIAESAGEHGTHDYDAQAAAVLDVLESERRLAPDAGPWFTRHEDGTITSDWPEGVRNALVSRELIEQILMLESRTEWGTRYPNGEVLARASESEARRVVEEFTVPLVLVWRQVTAAEWFPPPAGGPLAGCTVWAPGSDEELGR